MSSQTPDHQGLFVAFEGGDGAGKSTQAQLLTASLINRGFEVVKTREPGGTQLGKQVRGILLDSTHPPTPKAEALLFAADRAQHAAEVILPALERGAIVVSDRYLLSSIAYQGFARGLGAKKVAELSAWATGGLIPDLTILLQVSPQVGLARAKDRNRMESEPTDFHMRVAEGFETFAAAHPKSFMVINTNGQDSKTDLEAIALKVLEAVLLKL